MKLGARILKTGVAIMLALFLAKLFQLPTPVFAGIAAIFALQPTIYRSYLSIIEQIQGNIFGAIIAVVFVLLLGNSVITIGVAAIVLIILNLKLKIENTIPLSLVTLIAIMETPGDTFIQFALIRFSTIILGVLSAFIVNLVFLPPKYETKLFYKISDVTEEITKWIRLNTRHASEHMLLKNDIEKLKDSLIKVEQLYLMYKEERNYFKRNDSVKARKLVIYRQMISTSKKALDTLKRLHRYEHELSHTSDEFQQTIQHQLDGLISHHEQVMLVFVGKIKPKTPIEEQSQCINRENLFNLFLTQQNQLNEEDETCLYHSMQVVSAIIEYDEHVEHLDLLVNSFHSYHQEENEVVLEEEE
ncbi:aromatic acid exporter family protein [Cytobacillus spongiae]|uniref:FUSC family protein n=1 Tax=Cytobacillus spongiae TaxID=2901381 RepID=UPI001F32433C|nr:aromatic acid exporter family protein [Cytobacillus spongiae]UII56657.1 aromatic acid exporter family protein [Cytobacillus spongiae]